MVSAVQEEVEVECSREGLEFMDNGEPLLEALMTISAVLIVADLGSCE